MNKPLRGRQGVLALGALLMTLSVAACGSDDNHAETDSSPAAQGAANGSVSNAKAMLDGTASTDPGAFQKALLAQSTLTYADYESAMQAMASCVEERAPGTKVTLKPGDYDRRLFDSLYVYGGGDATMSVSDATGQPDASSPAQGTAESTASTPAPASDSTLPAAPPSSVEARGKTIARCQLEYSAYVEDRWRG